MTDDYIERQLNWLDGDKQCRGEESDILRQQCPIVVLGEPGMGKTERWLTARHAFAARSDPAPLAQGGDARMA